MHDADSIPPVTRAELPPEPPRWPVVVGTVSIVWASLNLLCGCLGLGWFVFMPQFSKIAEETMGEPMPAVMMPSTAQMALMVVGLFGAALLLWSGIATVTRRALGRPLHLVYGVASLLIAIPTFILAIQQQQALADWVAANPASKWAQQQQQNPYGSILSLGIGLVALLWPIFCLVWFAPAKHSPDAGAPDTGRI